MDRWFQCDTQKRPSLELCHALASWWPLRSAKWGVEASGAERATERTIAAEMAAAAAAYSKVSRVSSSTECSSAVVSRVGSSAEIVKAASLTLVASKAQAHEERATAAARAFAVIKAHLEEERATAASAATALAVERRASVERAIFEAVASARAAVNAQAEEERAAAVSAAVAAALDSTTAASSAGREQAILERGAAVGRAFAEAVASARAAAEAEKKTAVARAATAQVLARAAIQAAMESRLGLKLDHAVADAVAATRAAAALERATAIGEAVALARAAALSEAVPSAPAASSPPAVGRGRGAEGVTLWRGIRREDAGGCLEVVSAIAEFEEEIGTLIQEQATEGGCLGLTPGLTPNPITSYKRERGSFAGRAGLTASPCGGEAAPATRQTSAASSGGPAGLTARLLTAREPLAAAVKLAASMRAAAEAVREQGAAAGALNPARKSKQPHKATHGQGEADPSATSRVANPRAGLRGWKNPAREEAGREVWAQRRDHQHHGLVVERTELEFGGGVAHGDERYETARRDLEFGGGVAHGDDAYATAKRASLEELDRACAAIQTHFGLGANWGGEAVALLGNDRLNAEVAPLVRGPLCTALSEALLHGFLGRYHIWDFVQHACEAVHECFQTKGGSYSVAEKTMTAMVVEINSTGVYEPANNPNNNPNIRFRSFVCSALNCGLLHDWIGVLTTDAETMSKFYETWAFVRSSEAALPQMMDAVRPLADHKFALSLDYENWS